MKTFVSVVFNKASLRHANFLWISSASPAHAYINNPPNTLKAVNDLGALYGRVVTRERKFIAQQHKNKTVLFAINEYLLIDWPC